MPTILAIDAGNTRIKWGLHDGARWSTLGATPTARPGNLDAQWAGVSRGTRVIASNVAGDNIRDRLKRLCATRGMPVIFIESLPEQLGVVNSYRDPGQLGTDRWAALVAAHHTGTGHQLVVNVGTALTIDALTAEGRFLGGLIVPGPRTMRRSLDRATAALRLTEGDFAQFPRSTPDAITSGAVQACVGAIERMASAMIERDSRPGRIVLSGGAANELGAGLSIPVVINENLVLDGLALLARKD